jgi:hypothetical protein
MYMMFFLHLGRKSRILTGFDRTVFNTTEANPRDRINATEADSSDRINDLFNIASDFNTFDDNRH